jgi:hypothetical protein
MFGSHVPEYKASQGIEVGDSRWRDSQRPATHLEVLETRGATGYCRWSGVKADDIMTDGSSLDVFQYSRRRKGSMFGSSIVAKVNVIQNEERTF